MPLSRPPLELRREKIDRLQSEVFDLLIIGGGITGAGTAREAALRGLRVALVERRDFASGTSSKSARIIHGGLRYIASRQYDTVREACAERRNLLRTAPALVRPLAHTLPIYDRRLRALGLWAAMWLYDALAGFQNVRLHRLISAAELACLEPEVSRTGLMAAIRYYEAFGDDARLTLTTVLEAERHGALALNYAEVEALLKAGGQVAGAAVREALAGASFEVRARVVVNAAGPWNPAVQRLDGGQAELKMHPSKGIHVVVPRERLPVNAAVAFRATDGHRDMYGLPWRHTTILGTTDVEYPGDLDVVHATGDEVRRVLDATRRTFPHANLTSADVLSTFAGVRPLVDQAGVGAYRMSREHRVAVSASGLVSITGGKLTTHRRMARDTVEVVEHRLAENGVRRTPSALRPDRMPLETEPEAAPAAAAGWEPEVQLHLQSAYGARWGQVAALAATAPGLAQPILRPLPYLRAEIAFGLQREMALTLNDVMIRRMHFIHEAQDQGLGCAPLIAAEMAASLGWSPADTARQVADYQREVALTRRYREA